MSVFFNLSLDPPGSICDHEILHAISAEALDLAVMVQDQGTVLDRIDYNIEQTQVQVHEGYKQLKKADSYQKANKKLYCIVVLAAAIILFSFLFVIFKT